MRTKLFIFIFFFLSMFIMEAAGDVLYLKNGRRMEGLIKKETEEAVVLDVGIGTVKFNKSAIDKIEYSDAKKSAIIDKRNELEKERSLRIRKNYAEEQMGKQLIDIAINPMIELDFKTKSEIYDIRKKYVLQHPELVTGNYEPSEEVFGQIEDNKPWWGILGLCYYANGEQSLEGLSEESRFLANPFLLVGLEEGHAYKLVEFEEYEPKEHYPRPLKLAWNRAGTYGKVKYNLSSFWKETLQYPYAGAERCEVDLIAYNARDLGFKHFYIDPYKSTNIVSPNKTPNPVPIIQYIHCGGSSGYPGGSNNMSPYDPNVIIKVTKFPAECYIKLWREKPENANSNPDMVFVMELI